MAAKADLNEACATAEIDASTVIDEDDRSTVPEFAESTESTHSHSDKKAFVCIVDGCGASFMTASGMYRHRKNKHAFSAKKHACEERGCMHNCFQAAAELRKRIIAKGKAIMREKISAFELESTRLSLWAEILPAARDELCKSAKLSKLELTDAQLLLVQYNAIKAMEIIEKGAK